LTGFYTFVKGESKNASKDYILGEIQQNGKAVSQIRGNYMGWIEFDGVRYFDVRKM